MKEKNCPCCHHHCDCENLRCDRGRKHFGIIKPDDIDIIIAGGFNKLYIMSKEKDISGLIDKLTITEKKILKELVDKLVSDKKE